MTTKRKEKKIPTEIRVLNGIAYSFTLGLTGLFISCSVMRGNGNANLASVVLGSVIGFGYGIMSATEKDVQERNDRQKRIFEQNELTALLNKPRRLVPVEQLSPEQLHSLNLLIRTLDVWDDVMKTASGVPRVAAGAYILELQKIRREVTYLDWSESFTLVRDSLTGYMDAVIKKFHAFQADSIGWRWTSDIEESRKYIELALEKVGVMECY